MAYTEINALEVLTNLTGVSMPRLIYFNKNEGDHTPHEVDKARVLTVPSVWLGSDIHHDIDKIDKPTLDLLANHSDIHMPEEINSESKKNC